MIFYFTGTGNSRRAAQLLAEALNDHLEDARPYLRAGAAPSLSSEKPWVFVSPTYAWRLPRAFEELLRRGSFSGSGDAYFVMTCGGGTGGAEASLRALCRTLGLRFRGLLPVRMPENYVAMFPVPDEPHAKAILRRADRTLKEFAPVISAGMELPPASGGVAGKLLSGPVNRAFQRFAVNDRPFRVTEGCTGCGQCASLCPVSNISMTAAQTDGSRPVWAGRCIHCMACICGCPQKAIEYGKKSRGKPRYQCPDWEGTPHD